MSPTWIGTIWQGNLNSVGGFSPTAWASGGDRGAFCAPCASGQKELQDLLGIQAGSMSEIAAKLEGKGLIVRVRSEEDRRKVFLSITEQGRAWAAQGDETHIRRRRAELFAALTDEEQGTLEALLDKLSADWSQRLEYRYDGDEDSHRNMDTQR